MTGISPSYSRSRVNKAGDAIRQGGFSPEDIEVLDNWRASHFHIINTFQANLRRRAKGTNYLVGQRLKRKPTIIDKLHRQPSMQLSRMNDIAGCRVVTGDIKSLNDFRAEIIGSRAKHERLTSKDDQFNYIRQPKPSGYRGIHDVYKYQAYSKSADLWNDLRIEIQYRTKVQHAWATAVEVADLLTKNRGKFSQASREYERFFKYASEILARVKENSVSCLPKLSGAQLKREFENSEKNTSILRILENSNNVIPKNVEFISGGRNIILLYPFDDNQRLRGFAIRDTRDALKRYTKLEEDYRDRADVVLVRAEDTPTLRKVFQNYFTDTRDFVKFILQGLRKL